MDDIEQLLTDFNRVKAACQEMEQKKILVGLISDKVDSDVMIIAHAHEYGVPGKLPERSFIRKSFDTGQDELGEIVTGALTKMLARQISPDAAANSIGAQATQLVQGFIGENKVKPESDFKRKTQYTTLYETGTHIRGRLAYEVVSG